VFNNCPRDSAYVEIRYGESEKYGHTGFSLKAFGEGAAIFSTEGKRTRVSDSKTFLLRGKDGRVEATADNPVPTVVVVEPTLSAKDSAVSAVTRITVLSVRKVN
jgi:hypothetical protein